MLVVRLFRVSNFRLDIFFPKIKILLSSRNLVILNRAFLCSVNENPVAGFQTPYLHARDYYRQYLLNTAHGNLIFRGNAKTNSKTADLLNQLELNEEDNSGIKDQLYNYLNKELNQFTFDELYDATFLIMKFLNQNGIDPSWEKILRCINDQYMIRMSSWTGDELIKMTDISMVHNQVLRFKNKLLYKLIKKSSTGYEIVFLFYFFIIRKLKIPKEYVFSLQQRTLEILPEINSIEAGIIAEGYCKSFRHLQQDDLLYYILKKGIDGMETIDQIPFTSFCKFAKSMSNIFNWKGIPEFQKSAIETALRFRTEKVILLAYSGENIRYLDSNLETALMKEVKSKIRQLSLFHIERVTNINTLFNIHDEEFLKLALDVFEKKEMTEKNRITFILFLRGLIHHKIYPKNLLALVLEQNFVDNLKVQNEVLRTWWYIYCSLEIERPDCITVSLTPKVRNRIYQKCKFLNSANFERYQAKLWRVKKLLENRFGEGTVKYIGPLPHYSFGLLMRFDENLMPQKFPEEFQKFRKSHAIKPLKDNHIWMFITWAYHLIQRDDSDFVQDLFFQTQVRQLNALGYTVLPVMRNQFKSASVNNAWLEELESLINAKLEECHKNKKGAVTN